jgi:hypothetical protein
MESGRGGRIDGLDAEVEWCLEKLGNGWESRGNLHGFGGELNMEDGSL